MAGKTPHTATIDLSATWTALAASSMVLDCTIMAPLANSASAQIRVDGGTAQAWPPGTRARLEGADLSRIEVKGTSGDTFMVAGNTR